MNVLTDITKLSPEELLARLRDEVVWQAGITHRGGPLPRRFATQALILNVEAEIPLYRHPMDGDPVVLPFSPTVNLIRERLETLLDQKFNHVIIQEYRNGDDYIAEHADKTLDIAQDSVIVNYSVGATRVMKLRSKEAVPSDLIHHEILDIPLPHDSAFILDMETNRKFKHAIRKASSATGPRISLTFRNIATSYHPVTKLLSGQGAPEKGKATLSVEKLLHAWHLENSKSTATWSDLYSGGFPFISLNAAVQEERLLRN